MRSNKKSWFVDISEIKNKPKNNDIIFGDRWYSNSKKRRSIWVFSGNNMGSKLIGVWKKKTKRKKKPDFSDFCLELIKHI